MITSKQRANLRKLAHGFAPVVHIGKAGIEENVIKSTSECLATRELIKLKTLETSPETARAAADLLSQKTGAEVVQVIGNTFVLFLMKKKDSKFKKLL